MRISFVLDYMEENLEAHSSGLKTIQLNDGKAGMQGLDKELINKVIYEASKGTPYFAFQEKRQKSIDSKVNEYKKILSRITDKDKSAALAKMGAFCASLEAERDLSHSIVHIDMDAFYAAVEMEDNPILKNKPMAVGTLSMLSTSNFESRKYGVRAAMPGFIAKKLCPSLTIVPCNFDKYRKVSNKVRNIIQEYDPDYCPASLDEVYLDLTEFIKNKYKRELHSKICLEENELDFKMEVDSESYKLCTQCCQEITNEKRDEMAYDVVKEIRERIFLTTNLTASAGIAPNVMLAKVGSDQNKPNGQYQILSTLEAVLSFVSTLAVKKISGIGPVQGQILNAIGIHTCADMWEKRDIISILFKSTSADFYMRAACGISSTTVKSDHVRKSIGVEQTFREIHERDELHKKCLELCDEAVEDMKLRNMLGKVVVLKFKTTEFETHTRNQSLSFYSADKEIISKVARKLLDLEMAAVAPKPLRLRLMGIRLANLVYEGTVPNITKHLVKIQNYLKAPNSDEKESIKNCVNQDQLEASEVDGQEPIKNCENDPTISNTDNLAPLSLFQGSSVINCNGESGTLFEFKEDTSGDDVKICNASLDESEQSSAGRACYTCPVCGIEQNVRTLTEFNSHIDNCLNKATIKEILANDLVEKKRKKSDEGKQSAKKTKFVNRTEKRIEDYFH